jgi:outer membrane receptor for ferrienterochelin and colicins
MMFGKPAGWLSVAVFSAALLAGSRVEAQTPAPLSDLTLEQLLDLEVASVVGASRFPQKVTEAPAAVSIVTADEIARYGWRTLADVLRSVRGFYVTDDHSWGYVGTRGVLRPGDYNTRFLLLVDGHRINDNLYDQALVQDDLLVDLSEVERIEIVRGPSSSLYGTSAFFGIINIVTAPARAHGSSLSLDGGSDRMAGARLRAAQVFDNGAAAVISVSAEHDGGDRDYYSPAFDSAATNNGVATDLDAMNRRHFFARFDYRQLALRAGLNMRRKAYPTGAFDTVFNDRDAWVSDRRIFVDAAWEQTVRGGWVARLKGAYDGYKYTGSYPYDDDADASTAGAPWREAGIGDWLTAEGQFSRTFFARHRVTTGVEHRQNLRQRQFNYERDDTQPLWADNRHSAASGAYVQDEFRVHPRLLINAGLRADRTAGGHAEKPRVAFVFEPGKRTALKLVTGAAFRAPNVFERYYESEGYRANPAVTPETTHSVEAIAEKYVGRAVRFAASVFTSRINHLIALTPVDGDVLSYNNVDASRVRGVEGEIEIKSERGAQTRASYTYARARDGATGAALTNSPAHLTQIVASTPIRRGVIIAADVRALSSRLTRRGSVVSAHAIANMSLVVPLTAERLHLSLVVTNILNTRYSDPVDDGYADEAVRQRGRTARVRFAYRF